MTESPLLLIPAIRLPTSLSTVAGDLFGKIRTWAELGWVNKPIYFVTREEGSGTRDAFEHLVMKKEISDEALVQDSNGPSGRSSPNP